MVIKCNVKRVSLKFGQKVAITFGVTNIVWKRVPRKRCCNSERTVCVL